MREQKTKKKNCVFCNSTELLRELHATYVCEVCKDEVKAQYSNKSE